MSDFQVGDVVVCVEGDEESDGDNSQHDPFWVYVGDVVRVELMFIDHCEPDPLSVIVSGKDGHWPARVFRKITKADEQFTASIRAYKPHHNRVPA